MRKVLIDMALVSAMVLIFSGCGADAPSGASDPDTSVIRAEQEEQESAAEMETGTSEEPSEAAREEPSEATREEPDATELTLLIDGEVFDVLWEDNNSVVALKALAEDGPIEVAMSMYGGFEQVGSFGSDLPRSDGQMTTEAGDIVLYQGNRIVVFYGPNTWAYTGLGHIEGKTAEELARLLGEQGVTLILEMKQAAMHFRVDDPQAFADECGIRLIGQRPFFSEARNSLKKQLGLYTRIAMKVVDEGGRKGYILHYGLDRESKSKFEI